MRFETDLKSDRTRRIRALAPLGVIALLLAALGLFPGSASAAFTHNLLTSIPVTKAEAIAIDESNGDVYVYSAKGPPESVHGDELVHKFDPSEDPATSTTTYVPDPIAPTIGAGILLESAITGLAIDPTNGDLYVSGTAIWKFSPAGALLATLSLGPSERATGIAVDAAGDLYVSAQNVIEGKGSLTTIRKYLPNGEPDPTTPEIGTGLFHQLTSLALDGAGNLYALDLGNQAAEGGGILRFNPAGEPDPANPVFPRDRTNRVTVERATQDLYVDSEFGVVSQLSQSGAVLSRIQDPAGGSPGLGWATVDSATGVLYASDRSRVDVFSPTVVVPDLTVGSASALTPHSITLHGTVNPDGEGPASCTFLWGATPALGNELPCPASIPNGNAAVPVEARLAGLEPDTTYYYRLSASNHNGTNRGELAEVAQATTKGPGIHSESVSEVTSGTAALQGLVDPNGAQTSYFFEYGTTESYGSSDPVPPGELIGSGTGNVEASAEVGGLEPGTLYHYRLVAISEPTPGQSEEFDGPDRTFTTQVSGGSVSLLDARGWELVSPSNKQGASIGPIGKEGLIQASASGGALTFYTDSPTEAQPAGYANENQVFASRGPAGWGSRDIALPHVSPIGVSEGVGEDYQFFTEDLSHAVVQPAGAFTPLSAEASEQAPYLRANFLNGEAGSICTAVGAVPGSCYRPLVTGKPGFANVPPGTVFGQLGNQGGQVGPCPSITAICGPEFEGATPDGSHVVLSTSSVPVNLTTQAAPDGALYEWSGGRLSLITQLPEGEGGGPAFKPVLGANNVNARNAISADGNRIIWSASHHLYLRDVSRGQTLRLDAGTALFQIASSDDSKIFFTEGESELGETLYECAVVTIEGQLHCEITEIGQGLDGTVLGASENGEFVYFVANSVLAAGATQGSCDTALAIPGSTCNLYVRHAGQTEFVATLVGEDFADWGTGADLSNLTARSSPDGRWLAFMSQNSLTGYDNRDAITGKPDEEVYLFHFGASGAGSLICASCNPTGARPRGVEYDQIKEGRGIAGGDRVWKEHQGIAANVPGWTPYRQLVARYQSRYLSNSGRLFFNSADALVPSDTNGTEDVYEYEPAGVGNCTLASSTYRLRPEGCVGLISSGTSREESAFLDASESGNDVFFLTASQLVDKDSDHALDIYDARVGGGEAPTSPATECQGDSCQAPAQAPSDATPGSLTFNGPGNVTECPPEKALKKGRCTSRKSAHHHHRKHNHKPHHKTVGRRTNSRREGSK